MYQYNFHTHVCIKSVNQQKYLIIFVIDFNHFCPRVDSEDGTMEGDTQNNIERMTDNESGTVTHTDLDSRIDAQTDNDRATHCQTDSDSTTDSRTNGDRGTDCRTDNDRGTHSDRQ